MPVFTSSIEVTADYPTIKPSLNLNFARSRSLDPRIIFTRASNATYVGRDGLIKTVGYAEPRFDHDPETLESLGLLLEESRTNYLGNSEMLANWGFGVGSDAFTASSGSQISTNPDGSSPAYHYVPSSTVGFHRFNRSITVPTLDTNYVVSLFVKRVTAGSVSNMNRFVELEVTGNFNGNTQGTGQTGTTGGSAVTFDMENLVIETQTNNFNGYVGDAKIEPYPNGWYRLSYVFNPGIGTNFTGQVWWGHCTSIAGDGGGETGNGNPSFYFWGASVEKGSFISSHIPTPANSSVTRATERVTVAQQIASGDITIVGEYKLRMTASNQWNRLFGFGEGSSDIRPFLSANGNITWYNYGTNSPTTDWSALGLSVPDNSYFRFAFAARQNVANSVSVNGTTVSTQSNANPGAYVKWNELYLGWSDVGTSPRDITGHIKYFRVYNDAFTDTQLQLLST